ncbi:MAG TPA: hypothetical protein VLE93_01710 [Candidatus Saccharimonadales bacterium]|nr:hypothetical protein [Candidatus Saccharimonadales bacterium]
MPTKEATIQIANQSPASASEAALSLNQPLLDHSGFQSIDTALRSIFPTTQEETKVQKARAILQEVAANLSDQEVEIFITELQCLIDSWFDVYEKGVFNGLTLKELMKGG